MRRVTSLPIPSLGAVLLGLGVTACQMPPEDSYVTGSGTRAVVADARSVGSNARGEACLTQTGIAPTLDLPVARAQEAFCGGWTQPSARVYRLSGRLDLDQAAQAGMWRNWLDQRFQCEAPQATTIAGGGAARLLACTRRSNGAAHLALVTATPEGTVLADGIPASLPVIERLVTGQEVASGPVARSQAMQLAVSRYAADRVGADDEARIEQLLRLGQELNQTEKFAEAEDVYRRALELRARALNRQDDPNLATPVMHIAINLSNQGRFSEADRLFQRAAQLLARGSADRTAAGRLSQYRGMHALNRGDTAAAEQHLAAAEAAFRAMIPPERLRPRPSGNAASLFVIDDGIAAQTRTAMLGLAETLRYRAVVASRKGDSAQSAAALQESRVVLRSARLPPGILDGRALRAEGMALTRQNLNLAAAQRLEQAEARFEASLPGERPVAATLFLAGREWMAAGRTDDAVTAFRRGAEVLRSRQIGLTISDIIPYLDALERLAARNPANSAALRAEFFSAAQLAQRSETARFLAQTSARLAHSGNERAALSIRRREDLDLEIRSLLTQRDALLADARSTAEIDRRIAEHRALREEAEADVAAAAPEYLALRDRPVSASEASEGLGQGEALVQIILGADHGYAMALRNGQPVQVARLALGEARARQLVRAVRAAMDAGPGAGGALPPFDLAAAAELYDRLLRPLEPAFQGVDRLVIVPDGPLLALPFGILLTGPAQDGNLAAAPWLIRRQAITHTPSAQAFLTQRRRASSSPAPQPYIGFGDFIPASLAQLRHSFPPDRCGEDAQRAALLARLPGFAQEVRFAAREMGAGAQQRLGPAFTLQSVGPGLDQFRIVHFATHGLLPSDLTCLTEPSILVSNPPNLPNADRAFLTSSAIMRMSMNADLVILSACNTAGPAGGDGSDQSAEALAGLARAFFVAGARGVLASHWLANDTIATVLMTRMLAIQKSGVSSVQALRRAQIEVMEASAGGLSLAHPYYWAAFALIGDGRVNPPMATTQLAPAPAGQRG